MSNGTEQITGAEREYLVSKILVDAYEENPPLRSIENSKLTHRVSFSCSTFNAASTYYS